MSESSFGNYFRTHKITAAIGIVVAFLLTVLLAVIVVLNSNLLRPTLEHAITSKTGRETKINGDLRAHLLSWAPSLEIPPELPSRTPRGPTNPSCSVPIS